MKYNTVIIGFGKGGKTLAGKLAKKGEKVALIEKDPEMYGGTCINVGCLPSKRLVTLAARTPEGSYEVRNEYFKKAVSGKDVMTSKLRAANHGKLVNAGVEVIDGFGSFEDRNHVRVKKADGSEEILEAEKIIINTGSAPFIPEIEGLKESDRVYISETLMDIKELPEKLAIIGGGYIGLEFASMFANFGSEVTILQDSDVFLKKEDRDVAEAIEEVLSKQGVTVVRSVEFNRIDGGKIDFKVSGEEKTLEADAILVATGRRPNIQGLEVEKAGVSLTKRGGIEVNEKNRTNVDNIWATGDVIGGLQFTYISLDDSRIVLDDMENIGKRTTQNRGAFSYSVFMKPAFSRVGLSEDEAKAKGLNYRVVKMPASAIPKAKVIMEDEGLLKAIIDKDTDKILGAALFCAESYELINIIKLAMDNDLDYKVLRDFIYTHPTMAESFNDLFAL